MPLAGQLIVFALIVASIVGLILILTAFKRSCEPAAVSIPAAKVVDGKSGPIEQPRDKVRLRVSGGRLLAGLGLVGLGGMGLYFIMAMRALAEMANH